MYLKKTWLVVIGIVLSCSFKSQKIGNYVNNGSFENYFMPDLLHRVPYYWSALDSSKYFGELFTTPQKVPYSSYTFQYPYEGKNHLGTSPYYAYPTTTRGYPRNRLKTKLRAGGVYCVSMYVNLSDQSTHGIDSFGAYFGDNSLDTISRCNYAITYLMPQVFNPAHNILTDTMNWVAIKGTFVANGTEKYMLIGNFKSNANTDTLLVNPTNLPTKAADYLIDAISVIEIDLLAYAGPDQVVLSGDSAFIGREPDFAIDSGCVWYKLPNMTTAIDTISGFWVKPAVTTTYVVRQRLECSAEKWDTVVIYPNSVGLEKLKQLNEELKIYPVPAKDFIELKVSNENLLEDFKTVSVYNNLGIFLREEELTFTEEKLIISTNEFPAGVYFLKLKSNTNETVRKRFVIAR